MCYYKTQKASLGLVANRYGVKFSDQVAENFRPVYYENGFSHSQGLVITAQASDELQLSSWGLIPWWIKSTQDAMLIRNKTLNCISEEMWEKPSFRDAIKNGHRCLIPCTGFFEWRHLNGGKRKIPYFITLPHTEVFSLAGLCATWNNKGEIQDVNTYTVLTTSANNLMEKVHNSKKRMPVIIGKDYEKDWLNPSLTADDVRAFCRPINAALMSAHTISPMITDRKIIDKNVPEISASFNYQDVPAL